MDILIFARRHRVLGHSSSMGTSEVRRANLAERKVRAEFQFHEIHPVPTEHSLLNTNALGDAISNHPETAADEFSRTRSLFPLLHER